MRFCVIILALLCFPRGVRWGYAPQTAPKSQKWKRHCRLSGLSSRCGGVALVRIRSACALLRNRISLVRLSAGNTLGLRAPNLRQRVFDSLDSLHAAAGLGWCGFAGLLLRAVGFAFLAQRFALGSRLLFVLRQTGRLAISCVPIPPGRDRHSCVLAVSVRLSALAGSLRVWPFLYGDPDGRRRDAEDAGTGNGVGGES